MIKVKITKGFWESGLYTLVILSHLTLSGEINMHVTKLRC